MYQTSRIYVVHLIEEIGFPSFFFMSDILTGNPVILFLSVPLCTHKHNITCNVHDVYTVVDINESTVASFIFTNLNLECRYYLVNFCRAMEKI